VEMYQPWADSFTAFRDYVGEPPTKEHSLDRIDPFLGYVPGNVRWASLKQQANNKRTSPRVAVAGASISAFDLCQSTGLSFKEVKDHLKAGGSVEDFFRAKGVKDVGS